MSEITVETGELPVCVNCQFKHAVGLLHHVDPSMEKEKYSKTIELITEIGEGLMMTSTEIEDFIRVYQLEHKVEDVLTVARDLRHKIMEGSEERFEALEEVGREMHNPSNPENAFSKMIMRDLETAKRGIERTTRSLEELRGAIEREGRRPMLSEQDRISGYEEAIEYYRSESERLESKLREHGAGGNLGNPDGKCATIRQILESECQKAKRIIDATLGDTWPFCDVLNEYFTVCSSGDNPGNPSKLIKSKVRTPDIYTTRPTHETEEQAGAYIKAELQRAEISIDNVEISRGHDQPDGSTVYYVYLSARASENLGNPIPEACEFKKEPVKPKEYFDPDSFRTICPECPESRCALCPPELACATRIIIGCKQGEFFKGRCQVGTEAHVIYHG